MTERWIQTTIGAQLTLQRGMDITRAQQHPGSIPVVSSSGISSYHDTPAAQGPGVVLGRKGVVGSVYYIAHDYWPHDTTLWVKDFKGNSPRFVYYFFLAKARQIAEMDVGSANPTLNRNHVHSIETQWPRLSEQNAIAEVLGALDDKIEQNRLTGRALEQLARAIFGAWFVDFEPVKNKAAGASEFPLMPQDTFNALPAIFVESELGLIPQGWAVGPLRSLIRERKERVDPSAETRRLPYVPIDCIDSDRIILEQFKSGEEAKSSLVRFFPGDILFGAMRPYFHKVCLAPFEGSTRTTCFVLAPIKETDRAYALMATSDKATVAFATSRSVGSTIPYAKWDGSLAEMPCVLAPPEIRAAFGNIIDPIIEKTQHTVRENASLAKLRDYLLLRLMSCDVRVEVGHG